MIEVPSSVPRPNVDAVVYRQFSWLHVERPTTAETGVLEQRHGLDPGLLAECLLRQRPPRLVAGPSRLYLSLSVPVYSKLTRSIASAEVGVFVGPDLLATLHHGDVRPVVRAFRECQASEVQRAEWLGRGPAHLLAAVADALVASSLQVVEGLRGEIQAAEAELLADEHWDATHEVVALRRQVAALRRIVRPTSRILASLPEAALPGLGATAPLSAEWRNLLDRLAYLAEALESCGESVEGLAATARALTERRIARALRLLAVVAATALPVLVLLGLFALNFRELPLAGHPYAFELVLAAAAVLVVGALYLLRRSRWL